MIACLQRFRGGILGGELLTLSRYPIILVGAAKQPELLLKSSLTQICKPANLPT